MQKICEEILLLQKVLNQRLRDGSLPDDLRCAEFYTDMSYINRLVELVLHDECDDLSATTDCLLDTNEAHHRFRMTHFNKNSGGSLECEVLAMVERVLTLLERIYLAHKQYQPIQMPLELDVNLRSESITKLDDWVKKTPFLCSPSEYRKTVGQLILDAQEAYAEHMDAGDERAAQREVRGVWTDVASHIVEHKLGRILKWVNIIGGIDKIIGG